MADRNAAEICVFAAQLAALPSDTPENAAFALLEKRLRQDSRRRRTGSFYTPDELTARMLHAAFTQVFDCTLQDWRALQAGRLPAGWGAEKRAAIRRKLADFTLLDPACGTGNFYFAALVQLERLWHALEPELERAVIRRKLLEQHLFGIDCNAEALALVQWLAVRKAGPGVRCRLLAADALRDFESAQLPFERKFALVIGNPPYLSYGLHGHGHWNGETQRRFRENFPAAAHYKLPVYALFMEQALRWTEAGGQQWFVVPDSFLLGRYFEALRRWILQGATIECLALLRKRWFAAATGNLAVYGWKNTPATAAHQLTAEIWEPGKTVCRHALLQRSFATAPRCRFRLFFSAAEAALIARMERRGIPMDRVVEWHSGLIGKKGQKSLMADASLGKTWRPGLHSGREIGPNAVRWNGGWLNCDPAAVKSGLGMDYARPKLFLRQTGDALVAAADRSGLYALNNLHVGLPLKPDTDLEALAFTLNSAALNFYYRRISLEHHRALAQIDLDVLAALPLPPEAVRREKSETALFDFYGFSQKMRDLALSELPRQACHSNTFHADCVSGVSTWESTENG